MRYLVALLFLSGCNLNFPQIPDQDRAEKIVWIDTYCMQGRNPPPVQWIEEKDLNCTEWGGRNIGWYRDQSFYGDLVKSSQCVLGLFWDYPDVVQDAHPTNFKFSDSAYAHEFWHARMLYVTGDSDSNHTDPGFQPGGAVDQAAINLAREGL